MAGQDRIIAKVERVSVYRRNGDTFFLKWYNPQRGKRGNYQRRSTCTCELKQALALAADLNEALESGMEMPDQVVLGPKIVEIVESHPATKHERDHYPGQYRRHMAAVQDYVRFGRSPLLRDLKVEKVSDWVADLQKRGLAFETRRHFLLYLRRTSAMAPNHGLQDTLNGLRLDRRTEDIDIPALDLEKLRQLIDWTGKHEEAKWSGAVALMALLGLRPSEAIRLRVGDMQNGTLHVGKEKSKNDASERVLPLPKIVQHILKPLVDGRAENTPLLPFNGSEAGIACTLSRGVRSIIEKADCGSVPCKALRKSFATLCVNELGVDPALVEGFLGHKHPGSMAVTRRHYLKRIGADSLRPLAEAMDEAFGV